MTDDRSRVVVRMTALGEATTEGVIRFRKRAGEVVKRDEAVAEVETDKATVELPAPAAGVIESLCVADGATVTADAALYVLRTGAFAPTDLLKTPGPALPLLTAATLRWDAGHLRARARGLAEPAAAETALLLTAIARALASVPAILPRERTVATTWVDLEKDAARWVCAPLPVDVDTTGAVALARAARTGEPPGWRAQLRVLRLHDGAARSARLAHAAPLQLVIGPVRDEAVVISGAVVVRPIAEICVEAESGELLRFVAALAEQLARV